MVVGVEWVNLTTRQPCCQGWQTHIYRLVHVVCGCGLVHVSSHSKYDFQKQMFQSMVGGLFKSTPQAANTATGGLTV